MKKKTFVKLIFVAGSLFAAYCFFSNHEVTDLDKLAFQNVEALASGENDDNAYCEGYGSVDCRSYKVEVKISNLSLD